MAARRGNKSIYPKSEAPAASTHETRWRDRAARGEGIQSAYEQVSRTFPPKVSYEELVAALEALGSAFEDVAFSEAAIVLKSYNFSKGALKHQILKILAERQVQSEYAAAPVMDELIEAGISARTAAAFVVGEIGIEGARGATFEAVVDKVRGAHRRAQNGALVAARSGDTERRMRITWRTLSRTTMADFPVVPKCRRS